MADIDTQKNFLKFLKSKNIAAISTVSPDNQPMSATIYYIIDDDFTFYFMSKDTHKTRNIQTNNKVALLISRENAPISAQIHGIADQIQGNSHFDMKRDELIQSLLHNPFSPPIFEVKGDDIFIYKITPTWMRWLDLTDKSDNKGFTQILP
jgi:general stress protein 26